MANRICHLLITGAGSGLGRGLSRHFAREGHTVFAGDIHLAAVKETVAGTTATALTLVDAQIAAQAITIDGGWTAR